MDRTTSTSANKPGRRKGEWRRTYGVNLGKRQTALDKERRQLEALILDGKIGRSGYGRDVKRLAVVNVKLDKVYRLEGGRRKAA